MVLSPVCVPEGDVCDVGVFISTKPLSVGLQRPEEGAQQKEGCDWVWDEGGVIPNLLLNQCLGQMPEDKVEGIAQRMYLPGEH